MPFKTQSSWQRKYSTLMKTSLNLLISLEFGTFNRPVIDAEATG